MSPPPPKTPPTSDPGSALPPFDRPARGRHFTGSTTMDHGLVLITVSGEIDIATVTQFRALLLDAVAMGIPRVTVDMAGVSFMDARGLTVLATAAQRLRLSGSRLAVRSVPPHVYRLFEITGLTDALDVEAPVASTALVRALAGIAALPLARDVLDAALKLVVTMAHSVIEGADGVSITLPRNGRLGTVAASNDVVLEMDHDQYDTAQGPCLDAATRGERYHIDALAEELRWPAFVPRARARGIECILSTPLKTGDEPIGALNVYSRQAMAFAAREKQWCDHFADEASAVVASAHGSGSSVDDVLARVQQALHSREVIALAQGMVMQRDGITASSAHALLADVSRTTGTPLHEVANDLVGPLVDAPSTVGLSDRSAHGPGR